MKPNEGTVHKMLYIGVDHHKTTSQITVMDATGQILGRKRIPSSPTGLQSALGSYARPMQPLKPQEPIRQRLILDDPEADAMRLLFRLKGLLPPLLKALAVRGEALAELMLRLQLDGGK